eukprot:6192699-Pleurochrysis_carterae.AAC.1
MGSPSAAGPLSRASCLPRRCHAIGRGSAGNARNRRMHGQHKTSCRLADGRDVQQRSAGTLVWSNRLASRWEDREPQRSAQKAAKKDSPAPVQARVWHRAAKHLDDACIRWCRNAERVHCRVPTPDFLFLPPPSILILPYRQPSPWPKHAEPTCRLRGRSTR